MAKTLTILDAGDIDIRENPLHKSVYATLLMTMFVGPSLLKAPEGVIETQEQTNARTEKVLKTLVAQTINAFTHDGFEIVRREDVAVPNAFKFQNFDA